MNDRHDSADDYELVGYDDYGQPVYRQVPRQSAQQTYDSYGQQQNGYEAQEYGYDPYGAGAQSPAAPQQPPAPPSYDPWSGGTGPSGPPAGQPPAGPSYGQQYGQQGQQQGQQYGQQYDPYGPAATSAPQPRVGAPAQGGAPYIPQQAGVPRQAGPDEVPDASGGYEPDPAPDYRTEQFSFVEEPDGDSEDVIDWMKFTENRTERREEAKRRARSRKTALGVVFLLVVVSGVGYLWFAGKLPGTGGSGSSGTGATAGAQKRDVIALHLHNTKKGGTLTALLVDNTTTKQGTTVLLPNSLSLSDDNGETTTLAKSVDDDGRDGTRDALDTVLGTRIEGTWRLDTPYLENLVDIVGSIEVDTDTNVPETDKKKGAAPLVRKGKEQSLSGRMAVAYATYRAEGEPETAELQRFGAVMRGVLRKMSSDPQATTITVQTLAQIIEPPLTDKDLGAFLAGMADHAKGGDYETALLPVRGDGTLSAQESNTVVKKILGGTAKSPDKGSAVQVAVQNASGDKEKADGARVILLNGGFGYQASSPAQSAQYTSEVRYADAAQKESATEVAKTLGLPASAVKKGEVAANADVTVVLGQDYTSSS